MLELKDLSFKLIEKNNQEHLHITAYKYFYIDVKKKDFINDVDNFELTNEKYANIKILNNDATYVEKKLNRFIRSIKNKLKSSLNNNDIVYFDEDLELPLFGLNCIGIIDKGSEMIELKPLTGCNADCAFCSVDEGPSSKKTNDYLADKDFLINSLKEILKAKNLREDDTKKISIWINPHGEPLLYDKIVELMNDIFQIKQIKNIHIVTNGILLDKKISDSIHELNKKYKKDEKSIEISVSLSALSNEKQEKNKYNKKGKTLCKFLMGDPYNLELVKNNIEYASQKMNLKITPVVINKINDLEMEKIVNFAKDLQTKTKYKITLGIQKFCKNKNGRNIGKEIDWDEFFTWLKELEIETDFNLTEELGKICETEEIPIPCKKGDKIKVRIIAPGRYETDKIGLFQTEHSSRTVVVLGCKTEKGNIHSNVIASKHNIIVCKQ